MKKLTSIFLFVFTLNFLSAAPIDDFVSKADVFLKKYASRGKVDYASVKKNKTEIAELTSLVGSMKLQGLTVQQKQSFYINAYNILVIKGISDNYPVYGPLKIAGFFDSKKYKVAGESITLNTIEKVKLRKLKADPRYHFILVCAANGCPKLAAYSIKPAKVEAELNWRTKLAMKDSYFIRVKADQKKVYVSEIFKWYRSEFPAGDKGLIDYINKYRPDDKKIPNTYKVDFYAYDWALNKKK